MQNALLKNTERIGALTLFFVVLGCFGAFGYNLKTLNSVTFIGFLLVVSSFTVSVWHQFFARASMTLQRVVLSAMLLLYAAITFFIVGENFFYEILHADLPFWYLVSVYSLPAIALEGAIFTLIDELAFRHKEKRSQKQASFLFVAYAIVAVGANFAAILGYLSISHQLFFSRAVIVLVFISIISFIVMRNKHPSS